MTRERLDSLLYEKKKKLRNSKFEYCDYFDEYLEFVENNPCFSCLINKSLFPLQCY